MKQIELELNKRLLIVEYQDKESTEIIMSEFHLKLDLICKASELTEEISETLISKNDVRKLQSKMCGLKFKEGLIKMIESKGYYWGENPIDKRLGFIGNVSEIDKRIALQKQERRWQEAESKTFDLNKTLIFEIL